MHHCLNKRKHHAPQTDVQEIIPQKLQTRNPRQYQEYQNRTDEGRGSPLGTQPLSREILKGAAKRLKKEYGLRSCEAHERIAQSLGYNSYNHYLRFNK